MNDHYKRFTEGKSPVVSALLQKLFKQLDLITNKAYVVEEKKDSLHILKNHAFLGVHFLKDTLRLNIVLDHPIQTQLSHKLDKPSANVFHNKIDLHTISDLNAEIVNYLREAYKLKK